MPNDDYKANAFEVDGNKESVWPYFEFTDDAGTLCYLDARLVQLVFITSRFSRIEKVPPGTANIHIGFPSGPLLIKDTQAIKLMEFIAANRGKV